MKKVFPFLLIALIAISFTSCITTIQPLVTAKNAVTDNRLTGTWLRENTVYQITPLLQSSLVNKQNADSKNKGLTLTLSREDSLQYANMYLVSFNKYGLNYNMVAGLTRIGGQLYMDLLPLIANSEEPNVFGDPFQSTVDYLAGSTIAKVNVDDGSLKLHFLDGEVIKEQVQAGKMRLKHESNNLFGTFMITASTSEINSFLGKYGNDERIFTKNAVTLTRRS